VIGNGYVLIISDSVIVEISFRRVYIFNTIFPSLLETLCFSRVKLCWGIGGSTCTLCCSSSSSSAIRRPRGKSFRGCKEMDLCEC